MNPSHLIRFNRHSIFLHMQSDIICNAVSCLFAISKRSNCKEFLLDGEDEVVFCMMIALAPLRSVMSSHYIFHMSNLPSPQKFQRDTFLSFFTFLHFHFLYFCFSTIARQCPSIEIIEKQWLKHPSKLRENFEEFIFRLTRGIISPSSQMLVVSEVHSCSCS